MAAAHRRKWALLMPITVSTVMFAMGAGVTDTDVLAHPTPALKAAIITALSNHSCSTELVVHDGQLELLQTSAVSIHASPKAQSVHLHNLSVPGHQGPGHQGPGHQGPGLLQKRVTSGDAKRLHRSEKSKEHFHYDEGSAVQEDVASHHVPAGGKAKVRSAGFSGMLGDNFLRSVPQHRFDNLNAIATEVEYNTAYEQVLSYPIRKPFSFNVILATVKTTCADIAVQFATSTSNKPFHVDWKRAAFFAVFGLLYIGIAQWFFYVTMFSKLCPDALSFANKPLSLKLVDRVGQEDLVIQVLVDILVISPFVYFPIFYILKEFLSCGPLPRQVARQAFRDYTQNFWQDNLNSLFLWLPADFLIFTAPMYMRMPLDHLVSLMWTILMSYMRGSCKK